MKIRFSINSLLMRSKEFFRRKNSGFFILLSLLFHFFLLIFTIIPLPIFEKDSNETDSKEKKLIKISLTDQNIADLKKRIKEKTEIKNQVVNNELDSKDQQKTKETRFLGEKDQSFDRQTVAKNIDIFNKAGKGKDKGEKSKLDEKLKKELNLNDLALKSANFDEYDKFKKAPKLGIEDGDEQNLGLSANNDYIEEIPIGDVTHLNTVEFKYYGFYNRIRKRLEQYWGVNLKDKAKQMYKKGRVLVPGENYITSLQIVLDEKGNIISINVLSASGQQELDSAAIDSFNKAGPFPNPPNGMVKEGKVVLEWGFVVKS